MNRNEFGDIEPQKERHRRRQQEQRDARQHDERRIAFEVTFEIVLPKPGVEVPFSKCSELVRTLACVVVDAAGLPRTSAAGVALIEQLATGEPARVRLSSLAFARFFTGRRAVKGEHRLKWNDAVEIEVPA